MTEGLAARYQRLTPPGVGGIHVFAVEGQGLEDFLAAHFVARGRSRKDLSFGHLIDGDDLIDEVIVHRRSWRADISVHGSVAVERRLSQLLESSGFVRGEIAEPIRRRSLAPALYDEADACLRQAVSPHAVLFFLAVLEGGLAREIAGWIATLAEGGAQYDARSVGVEAAIESLLKRADFGLAMSQAPRIVLAGPVNAGKSTLFNALLGQERTIVSDEAGTTRDLIEAPMELDGYPFNLIDTAGIRETAHEIEGLGVGRAQAAQRQAALVVRVQTAANMLAEAEEDDHPPPNAGELRVAGKIDELTAGEVAALESRFPQVLQVSAKTGAGLDELRRQIIFRSPFAGPAVREFPCPFTRRQVSLLSEAQAVLPHDPQAAASLLRCLLSG